MGSPLRLDASDALQHDREALATGDAQGGEAHREVAGAELVGEREHDARAAHADRGADGDAAAVHVGALQRGTGLRGPGWQDDTANDWRRGVNCESKPGYIPGYKGKK